jgi:hypothetical protein
MNIKALVAIIIVIIILLILWWALTPVKTRYVRLAAPAGNNRVFQLNEIYILDADGKNWAQGATVTASGPDSYSQWPLKNLTDGNDKTTYHGNHQDANKKTLPEAWVLIDLGAEVEVKKIVSVSWNDPSRAKRNIGCTISLLDSGMGLIKKFVYETADITQTFVV